MIEERKHDFSDLSLPITEEEYRNDGAMHYSTLSTFDKGGFHAVATLGEKKESPSLTFGSIVDCLMTDGMDKFKEKYYIAPITNIPDNLKTACKYLYTLYWEQYKLLSEIPEDARIAVLDELDYGKTWRRITRLEKLAMASGYYSQLIEASNKELILQDTYQKAQAVCEALRTSEATKDYFSENLPFDDKQRYFQLKFSAYVQAAFNGDYTAITVKDVNNLPDVSTDPDWIRYSCMADEIVVDYKNKEVWPIDLKTTSSFEDEFYNSFIKWDYQIQARLYWRLIRAAMNADDYFRDFKLHSYTFIVVNRDNPLPLTWKYEDTTYLGTLRYGRTGQIICKDPFALGMELKYYLTYESKVQKKVSLEHPNSLTSFLDLL